MKLKRMSFILLSAVVLISISVAVLGKINSEESTKDSSSSDKNAQLVTNEEPNEEAVQQNESNSSDEKGTKVIKEDANSDSIHLDQEIELNQEQETEIQREAEKAEETKMVKETESNGVENTQANAPIKSRFSSREEAMQFVFSRFTAEEIAMYNRIAENGLTPEQQAMAVQVASSRFSAEEIAAIEAALRQ
ncbi:hypothetical protein ABER98_17040 [Domibacillus aminovorans]|uniref:hypothetical protein n=1 Tax=Domibacillus aminovorans TaxID=29332 RepID=UPI003D1F70D3